MSGQNIWCFFNLRPAPARVKIPASADVDDLKEAIREKFDISASPSSMILWKLKDPESLEPEKTLADRIKLLGDNFEDFAIWLNSGDKVLELFPDPLARPHIQVIVQVIPRTRSPQTPEHSAKRPRLEENETVPTPTKTAQAPSQGTLPRIWAKDVEPAMFLALKPFTQYISYLAEGKLDGYFDSIQHEESVKDLRLPTESTMLLLHNLGNNVNMEEIGNLFTSDTVHLFAVSGSGKTRRTLEGLCHYWGFYFTSQKEKEGLGSRDFEWAIEIMKSMSGWDNNTDTQKLDPEKNVPIANRAFAMLLCARIFVLKHLLKNLPVNTDVGVARKRWVLAQVLPPSFYDDIFTTIIKSLYGAHEYDMLSLVDKMLLDVEMVTNAKGAYFAVIDEAQVAAEYLNDSFRSFSSGTNLLPVLHAFYKFLNKTNFIRGIILAGTALSMQTVKKSQVAKPGSRREPFVFVEFGRFTRDQIHKDYIHKYFPLLNERLLERILYWFSGRYRFTASLIELLLSTQRSSPHRILSAFVKSMTQFTITDAIDLEEKEPELTDATIDNIQRYEGFDSLAIDRLFKKCSGNLIQCLFDAFMRWRIGSETTMIPMEEHMHELVALGIAHLEKTEPGQVLDPTKNYPVYLCEPLVVLFLSSSFNEHLLTPKTWIIDAFRTARNASSRGTILEEAVLLVLLQKFGGKSCALSDVFHCNQPWGLRKVTLVSLKRMVDGSMQCFPVSWTSGCSDRLGLKAVLPETVLEFMNNPNGKCFVLPDNLMGPDLLFFLQDVETKELILGGLQCKLIAPHPNVSGWRKALDSVTPDFFYTNNTKNGRVQYAPSKYPGHSDDIMDTIELMLGPAEYQPMVDEYWEKLHSSTAINEQLESKPSRKTPRYLRLIATLEAHQQWKSECSDDVGVLRWELVEAYLGSTADIVMGPPIVA